MLKNVMVESSNSFHKQIVMVESVNSSAQSKIDHSVKT